MEEPHSLMKIQKHLLVNQYNDLKNIGEEFYFWGTKSGTDKKWQEIRTDGEMMWVLRNGSPGTEMPVRVGKVINEEEGWSVIHFIRTLKDKE